MRRLPAAALVALTACATTRQITALRQVDFAIDRVQDVHLAGVSMDRVRTISDLDLRDGARLAAAVARGTVPLDFVLHLAALNPEGNRVTARLVRLTWTLSLNGRETVSGILDTVYAFPPGVPQDVAVPVQLDLYRFFQSSGRDAFELARGLSGGASRPTLVTVTASPVIETPLGGIRYPAALTIVRRTVGGP